MNCWEFTKCGREAGGMKLRRLGLCPAYPNHGKDCAYLGATVCTADPAVLGFSNPVKNLRAEINQRKR